MNAKDLARRLLRGFALSVARAGYNVRTLNLENIPEKGGVLMVSNHTTFIDALLISLACPRPVRFVIEKHYLEVRTLGWFLRLFNVVPISPDRAKNAIRTTAEAVREGSVVCIFPEGRLSRTGMLNEFKKGFELIARQARCEILPVYLDGLWGSVFSFERFRYFSKFPKRFPYPVTINFGPVIPTDDINGNRVRTAMLDLSAEAFAARRDLRVALGEAVLRALRRRRKDDLFIDLGRERRCLQAKRAGASALALARRWKQDEPGRTGILLPAGSMGALLNMALVLAGRVPVNLPLSLLELEPAKRDTILNRHGITTVITSRVLLSDQPWPASWIDMREAVSSISIREKLVARIALHLSPHRDWNEEIQSREAVGYLTETNHELVTLSQFNLLAAVDQIDSSLVVMPHDRILSQTTLTTPAALVLGLWYPLLKRGTAIYRGPAARAVDLPWILRDQQPQIVLMDEPMRAEVARTGTRSTDGAVRIWFDFHPERLAEAVVDQLEDDGATYCLGLAPPELGAIVFLNTNDPHTVVPAHLPQTGNRPGTVGRMLPGLSARLRQNGEASSLWKNGDLLVRGASLPHPDGKSRPWIRIPVTGRFDREGYFTVEQQL